MDVQPEVVFVEQFVPEPDILLRLVLTQTDWDARMQARQTASFGVPYNYSNVTYDASPMPVYLQAVCDAVRDQVGFLPNNCLLNRYVDGSSRMGFHADSTAELVPGTGVAIVSLGGTRTLTFRRTLQRDVVWECSLPHGSLLYLPARVQSTWQHAILKQDGAEERVSLTFRALTNERETLS